MRGTVPAALAVVALVAAGCGSDGEPGKVATAVTEAIGQASVASTPPKTVTKTVTAAADTVTRTQTVTQAATTKMSAPAAIAAGRVSVVRSRT